MIAVEPKTIVSAPDEPVIVRLSVPVPPSGVKSPVSGNTAVPPLLIVTDSAPVEPFTSITVTSAGAVVWSPTRLHGAELVAFPLTRMLLLLPTDSVTESPDARSTMSVWLPPL